MKNLLPVLLIGAALGTAADPWVKGEPSHRPTLFKQFGDVLNTPDGLALDSRRLEQVRGQPGDPISGVGHHTPPHSELL